MQLFCLGLRRDQVGLPWKKIKQIWIISFGYSNFVMNFNLMSLFDISYDYAHKGLILALVERWNKETSILHVSVLKITVTLDDVLTLLHRLIVEQLCPNEFLEFWSGFRNYHRPIIHGPTRATSKLRQCHGPQVRLSWLRNLYNDCSENQ